MDDQPKMYCPFQAGAPLNVPCSKCKIYNDKINRCAFDAIQLNLYVLAKKIDELIGRIDYVTRRQGEMFEDGSGKEPT